MALEQQLAFLLVVAGMVLMVMEAVAPGAHLIVLGVALFGAGLIGMYAPEALGLNRPLALATLILAIGAVSLYVYRRFDFYGGKGMGQTSSSDSLAGKRGRVTERVTETEGEIKVEDGGFNPFYRARSTGAALEPGTEVVVVDPGGGNVVTVAAADGPQDQATGEPDTGNGDEGADVSGGTGQPDR
jgi:membrane protein implicated in regulation of membrane protease activity